MASSWISRRVALVTTDVSKELSASFIKVKRIGELVTMLAVTRNRSTLRRKTKEALSSSETSVRTRATQNNIPEDGILHSHRRKNLKFSTPNVVFTFCLSLSIAEDVPNLQVATACSICSPRNRSEWGIRPLWCQSHQIIFPKYAFLHQFTKSKFHRHRLKPFSRTPLTRSRSH
jgi:hypothetical protein